jgi:hypothetical protein
MFPFPIPLLCPLFLSHFPVPLSYVPFSLSPFHDHPSQAGWSAEPQVPLETPLGKGSQTKVTKTSPGRGSLCSHRAATLPSAVVLCSAGSRPRQWGRDPAGSPLSRRGCRSSRWASRIPRPPEMHMVSSPAATGSRNSISLSSSGGLSDDPTRDSGPTATEAVEVWARHKGKAVFTCPLLHCNLREHVPQRR